MELILKSLIPITFVIFLGWFVGRYRIVDNKCSSHLANLIVTVCFPSLLLYKTATATIGYTFDYRFVVVFVMGLIGMYALMFALNHFVYRRSIRESCQASLVCSFPNMAFMGIPIFLVLFDEQSLIAVVIGNIITSLLMLPLTVSILELSSKEAVKTKISSMVLKVFTKPLVLAPICGFMMSRLNFTLPILAGDSLKLIGNVTSGLSLFTLGLIMSTGKVHRSWQVIRNVFLKNCLQPFLVWALIYFVYGYQFDGSWKWVNYVIILCAMPSAITSTMIAVKYEVLESESTSTAIVGTMVSLFSLAIVMRLLGIGL